MVKIKFIESDKKLQFKDLGIGLQLMVIAGVINFFVYLIFGTIFGIEIIEVFLNG